MSVQDEMLAVHQRTWHGFCRLMTWVVIGVVVVLGFLGIVCL